MDTATKQKLEQIDEEAQARTESAIHEANAEKEVLAEELEDESSDKYNDARQIRQSEQ